jgi:hypothetical protein
MTHSEFSINIPKKEGLLRALNGQKLKEKAISFKRKTAIAFSVQSHFQPLSIIF